MTLKFFRPWLLVVAALLASMNTAFAFDVGSGTYKVYTDSSGDLYLRAQERFIPIAVDIFVPILLPPNASDIYLRAQNGSYLVDTAPTFSTSTFSPANYEILSGNFDGQAGTDLFLQSNSGSPGFYLLNPASSPTVHSFAGGSVASQSIGVYNSGSIDLIRVGSASDSKAAYYALSGQVSYGLEWAASNDWQDNPSNWITPGYSSLITTSNTIVGNLSGRFAVSRLGSGTYSIPLTLPPGINGLQPHLSLDYNGRGGIGLLGSKWNLGGIPIITPCGQHIYAGDPINKETFDKFCLNGQRLKLVSGTYNAVNSTYRTLVDTYSLIERTGSGFLVRTKSGLDITFDHFQATKSLDGTQSGSLVAWYPSQYKDRYNNTMTLSYLDGDGETTLQKISYANGNIVVDFNTANASFVKTRDFGDAFAQRSKLLSSIDINVNAKKINQYNFEYQSNGVQSTDQLTAIQDCGYSTTDSTPQCEKSLQVAWNPTPIDFHVRQSSQPRENSGNGYYVLGTLKADLNGDQISDLITILANGEVDVYYGGNDGLSSKNILLSAEYQPPNPDAGSADINVRTGFAVADINNDGRDDLIYAEEHFTQADRSARDNCTPTCQDAHANATYTWKVLLGGSNTIQDLLPPSYADQHIYLAPANAVGYDPFFIKFQDQTVSTIVPMDVDGDHKPEFLIPIAEGPGDVRWELFDNQTATNSATPNLLLAHTTTIAAETYSSAVVVNAYGDGQQQAMLQGEVGGKEDWALLSIPKDKMSAYQLYEQTAINNAIAQGYHPYLMDINGDGLTDILMQGSDSAYVDINTGVYWDVATHWRDSTYSTTALGTSSVGGTPLSIADINGDGRDDVIAAPSDGKGFWSVYTSCSFSDTGDATNNPQKIGFCNAINTGIPYTLSSLSIPNYDGSSYLINTALTFANRNYSWFSVGDFTGDGLPDVIEANGQSETWDLYPNQRKLPASVSQITDSLGNKTVIHYADISADPDYSIPPVQYPYRAVRTGLAVVNKVDQSNGLGGLNSTEYHYQTGIMSLDQFGFLGFGDVETDDLSAGTITRTHFGLVGQEYSEAQNNSGDNSSNWWLNGALMRQETKKGSQIVSASSSNWSALTLPLPNGGYTYYPYVAAHYQATYDTNNAPVSVTETTNTPDSVSGSIVDTVTRIGSGSHTTPEDLFIEQPYYRKEVQLTNLNNDTSNWLLGFAGTKTVSEEAFDSTGGSADTKTQVTQYTQNPGTLDPKTVTQFSNDAELTSTTTYSYDANGNVTDTRVEGTGIATHETQALSFLDGMYPQTLTNALGQQQTNATYDERFGKSTGMTDIDGLTLSSKYDAFGRPISQTDKNGTVTTTTYAWCDSTCPTFTSETPVYKVTTVSTNPAPGANAYGAPPATQYYDSLGRLILTQTDGFGDAGPSYVEKDYDDLGRLVAVSEPFKDDGTKYFTDYKKFDAFNRAQEIDSPSSSGNTPQTTITFGGNATGRTQVTKKAVIGVSSDGSVSSQVQETDDQYNALGQLTSRTEAAGSSDAITTTYSYDALGKLSKTTVNGDTASTVTWTYDDAGNLVDRKDPNSGDLSYKYDPLGNTLQKTDQKGQITKYAYDALNRMQSRIDDYGQADSETTNWYYDNDTHCDTAAPARVGNICKVTQPGFVEDYDYDAFGHPQSVTTRIQTGTDSNNNPVYKTFITISTYDAYGRTESVQYPNVYTVFDNYGDDGYLHTITDGANVLKEITAQDARGNTTQYTLGNGLATQQTYDPANGLLLHIQTGSAQDVQTGTVQDETYTWYSNGNLYSRTNKGNTTTQEVFGYDALNRLETDTNSNGTTDSYTYYPNGNIKQFPGISGDYQYAGTNNAGPDAVTSAGGMTYAYDADGNMTSRNGKAIIYSSFNKPISIDSDNGITTFAYGPDRSRYRKVENGRTTYYLDGGNYEEVDSSTGTTTTDYIGDFLQHVTTGTSGVDEYLLRDQLGSIRVITDASGTVLATTDFSAFGTRSGNPTFTNYGFTGQEHLAESGLIHMNGRVYDPEIGRFLSVDPEIQDQNDSQNYNGYSYVLNNPLNKTDPSGYCYVTKQGINCLGYTLDQIGGIWDTAYGELKQGHYFNAALGYTIGGARMASAIVIDAPGQFVLDVGNAQYRSTTSLLNGNIAGGIENEILSAEYLTLASMTGGASSVAARSLSTTETVNNVQDSLINEVADIRSTLPSKIQTRGNMGIAYIDIPGLPERMAAHSGIDMPTEAQQAQGIVGLVPETFPSSVVPTASSFLLHRSVDSEAKILNNIALQLGDSSSISGDIYLFTERAPCSSCENVIKQFNASYPNINLNILDNGGNIVPPLGSP